MLPTALWSQWGLSLPQGADLEQKLESFKPQTQFGRVFNLRCPCFICRCRRNREAGKGRSSQLMFNAKCSYEIEHPSANQPLAELSPAPLIHPVTWFIHTEGTNPPQLCTLELLSLPQGQLVSLGQIHGTKSIPGAIPLKSQGFYTWDRCEAIA